MRRSVRPRRSLGTGSKSPPPRPNMRPAGPPPAWARRWKPTPDRPVMRGLPGGQRVGFGDALRLEPALGIDRRHAAVTRRGDGLPVAVVVHVAGDEHALDRKSTRLNS